MYKSWHNSLICCSHLITSHINIPIEDDTYVLDIVFSEILQYTGHCLWLLHVKVNMFPFQIHNMMFASTKTT